ncbi:integrase, catalytic region, zinc finger, CCHC-type containing protein [Tanacetum coccineum]|uniref:Integrase, catalytic region, zinc finger, CCHC-type containing protein n=1 Tax=Tanacetum coccineum TaxID=301880 RepID=A0ABQ5A0G8_9ASTR
MTNTETVDAEPENVNQEGAGNLVKDEAQAKQKTEVPIPSSSISSDYAAKYLNFDNIPPGDTEVVSIITALEKDVKELKTVDHSVALLSTIKFNVLNAIKEYIETSLDDALYKVLKKHDADFIKEQSILAKIVERLRQQYVPEKNTKGMRNIKMEQANDYSRFTWVKFLRSKDETPEFVINFLKQIQVGLNKTVRYIRTYNGTEFVNQVMSKYYEGVGIFHQKSVPRTPQQNGVVERRNHTLVEAARTMLIFSTAPMFLWAEPVATACYTQNRSLIQTRHNKTPYELVHDKKPDLTFLRVFGAMCYPTNDSEDLGKLQAKADIGIFVGYAPSRKGYRVYNKRTHRIMETIHVTFDELHQTMAPVRISSEPEPIMMTPG